VSETGRFTILAGIYNAGRPAYPPEVADFILDGMGDPSKLTIADLGAGTGTSSRLLAERGATVYAIEPNAAMRAKAEAAPRVTWIDAPAEHTGLNVSSVDLVTALQAFHWFDRRAAFKEILRILRPNGRAAVVFYERDESDPFTMAYGDIIREYAVDDTERKRADSLEAFRTYEKWKNLRQSWFMNRQALDQAGMADRVKSTSYIPQSGPQSERLRAAVDALFARYAVDGRVNMCLQTLTVTGER